MSYFAYLDSVTSLGHWDKVTKSVMVTKSELTKPRFNYKALFAKVLPRRHICSSRKSTLKMCRIMEFMYLWDTPHNTTQARQCVHKKAWAKQIGSCEKNCTINFYQNLMNMKIMLYQRKKIYLLCVSKYVDTKLSHLIVIDLLGYYFCKVFKAPFCVNFRLMLWCQPSNDVHLYRRNNDLPFPWTDTIIFIHLSDLS